MRKVDTIIIGGGPGGYEVAADLAAKGQKVILIERDRLGGTCLNRGCIPTKCLCATASTLLNIKDASVFGITVDSAPTIDMASVMARVTDVTDRLREGIKAMLRDVEVIEGEARMMPDKVVEVGGEQLTADLIIIATGSKAAMLPIPGAELAMTSDDLLKLDHVPASIAIIGGGVIGIEFASILAALGSQVTVVEYCREILPPFDAEIAKRLRTILSRRGIKFITSAAVEAIRPGFEVEYEGKKGKESITADMVAMAVGRRPVTPEGIKEAGIETDARGFIKVDDWMNTSIHGICAVGDVNGRCMLAHAASAQARRAIGEEVDLDIIPSAVFSQPEAAMVGLTEQQAIDSDHDIMIGKASFSANGKALAMGEADGTVKMIFDRQSGLILGCHIIGPHAADLVAEVAALMYGLTTRDELAGELVHGHPTLSEILPAAARSAK